MVTQVIYPLMKPFHSETGSYVYTLSLTECCC